MKPLHFDPAPIASILELINLTTFSDLIFTEENDLQQYILPKFKLEQIQTLRDAADDIVSITEFFTMNEIDFKLSSKEIPKLVKIIDHTSNTEVSKYASCVILVGFVIFVNHIFFLEPIQFSILNAILHVDPSYREIGLSSFFFAFKIIARHKIETITPDFLQSITYFFIFDYQYPVETVEVFYKLAENAYKVKSIHIPVLLHISSQLSQCKNITFPSNLVDKFLMLFQPDFLKLNIDHIVTFSNLLNNATPFEFKSSFTQLPQSILNYFQQNCQPLPLPQRDTSEANYSISINDQTIPSSSYFSPGFDFFNGPFNPKILKSIDEITPITDQASNNLNYLFSSKAFVEQYSIDFLKALASLIASLENKSFLFELENIFFKCITLASKIITITLDFNTILNLPIINDPQITFFNTNCNYLFAVRKEMIDFLLISEQLNFFKQFIQYASKWPLFYAEVICYLRQLGKDAKIYLTINQNLNIILDSFNLYSKASHCCKDADQQYIKEIRICRSYLISFLSEMISEYNDMIMNKDKIIYPLIGLLFERNLRDFTLNILKNYLLISQNPTPILNGISTVINGSMAQELLVENNNDYDHYNQCIDLLISLFEMLNEVFSTKDYFDGIETVFRSVSSLQLKKKGSSIDFFYSYLNSLYLLRRKYQVKPLIPFISKCIHIFYQEDEFDENLYNNLVRFIQDETIQSPEFLHLILNLFEHSSFFDRFMNLLDDLLKNKENRIICHHSKFDEYLINCVYEDEDVHIQKSLLKTFKKIAETQSSSSVVFKFISKLRPNDNSFLPNNEEILLEVLREMVLEYYFENANISYSCGKKYESSVKHYENTSSKHKFTFYFWIFFHNKENVEDNQEYTLIDVKNAFSIKIINNQLYLKGKDDDENSKFPINGINKYWKWNLISISSHKKYSKLSIQVNNLMPQQKLNYNHFDIDPSQVTIGDEKIQNNDIEIYNVSFMKHEKNIDPGKIYKDGPRKIIRTIHFHKVDENKNGEKNAASAENSNFVYYLLNSWEIDIILPLFALNDINYSGENCQFLNSFYYSMEIFVPAFLSLKNANSDIFLALSCILLTYSASKLTFSMYNRFFELYEFISDEELKDVLFVNVLSNDEIWSRNESEVEEIVEHWSKYLEDAFVKHFSFSYVLNYSYSYLNLPKSKFENCTKSIRSILVAIAKDHFTKEDFQNLIIECTGLINESSFLTLQRLVYEITDKLKSMKLQLSDVIRLNRIIIYKNQFLISEMIESIIILHSQKLIANISLFDHLTLILQELPATAIRSDFFKRMISHLEVGVAELIPICAWYCFKDEDNEASKQFTSAFCSFKTFKKEEILIWPLILALNSEHDIKSSIISHITKAITEKWKEILILIDLIFTAIDYDPKDLQFYYMDYLLQEIISSKEIAEKINLQEFIDYYAFLIFYQKSKLFICDEMVDLFQNTYMNECRKFKKSDTFYAYPQVLNANIIKISKDESYNLNFVLFFRIDSNDNHMIDDFRLKKLVETTSIHNQRSETLNKAIIYLLNHQHSGFVTKTMKKLNISIDEITKTPVFLKTLNQVNYTDISAEYKKIFKDLSKQISDLIKNTLFGFANCSIDYHPYGDFQSIVPQRRKKNRIIWARLWSSLSISKGPWDSKMVTEYRGPSRWKRDHTLCFARCPMKMKLNYHFITHGKSLDKKPKPKTALALFADSSADLMTSSKSFDLEQAIEESPLDEVMPEIELKETNQLSQMNALPDESLTEEVGSSKKANKIILIVNCKFVKITGELDAKFILFKDKIVIQVINQKSITITFDKIKSILKKNRFHRPTSIEIYTYERLTFFIDFQDESVWNTVIDNLAKKIKCKDFLPKLSFSSYFQNFNFTNQWKQRDISNFEYLMHLNILSGRTFNDLSQYPFLPWILTDYKSSYLDLSNEAIYRPLCKPIGTVDQANLKRVTNRYKDLLSGFDDQTKPNMFPSGPISPLSICLFLTRMEPFTTLHVQLQGGKFDVPDRLVTSIEQLFIGIIRGNAESWELSPEFFFQAEFLTNDNEFDLGKINDERIDDIELPKWSNSPLDFIYKHRKALESDFVSDHLNEWIDLNFGYLQKNPDVFNLYDDKLYEDVWQYYSYNDERTRKIIETTLSMVGQIPPRIFKEPHPRRRFRNINFKECHQEAKLRSIESPIDETSFCVFKIDRNDVIALSMSSKLELTTLSITIDNSNGNKDVVKVLNKEQFSDVFNKGKKNNKTQQLTSSDFKHKMKKVGVGKFAIVDDDSFMLYSYDQTKKYIFEIPYVKCITSLHDMTVFSSRESILNIYQKNKRISATHQYRDVITCCTISNTFQMIVTGTKDGGLIIGTLSGINVRVIELGSTPKKVLITPGWGFIVAYTEPLKMNIQSKSSANDSSSENLEKSSPFVNSNSPQIVVHSLNGTFVGRMELNAPIDEWLSWKSKAGFDFIAFSQGRKIFYTEVYFLEKFQVVRVTRDLVSFVYDFENNTFVFVEKDGVIEKLFYPIDDLNIGNNNVNK